MEFRCLAGGSSATLDLVVLCVGKIMDRRAQETVARLGARIKKTARDFSKKIETVSGSLDIDDLTAVGLSGAVQAAERFCPSYGLDFDMFVMRHAKFEMINEIRRVAHSRSDWERREKISDAQAAVAQETGRPATDPEIADHLGLSLEELEQQKYKVKEAMPTQLGGDALSAEWLLPVSVDCQAEECVFSEELLELLKPGLASLSERDRQLLQLRFEKEMTFQEIGEVFGVSKQRIAQLLQRVLRDLRDHMSECLTEDDEVYRVA